MSWLSTLAHAFVPQPPDLQERSEFPSFDEQLANIRRSQSQGQPWRQASIDEALGVPAILGAVSLISGVVGTLSLEAYRSGELVSDPADVPRLITRPNPRSTPGVFFRDTAFYLATRGEAWWWIARRDTDGLPMSLFPIPPWEITVNPNERDRLSPEIRWGNKVMNNDDLRQITYLPDHNGLRGVGPLQLAGAATSVTVEANTWAANFYSGALPSLVGTTSADFDELDTKALDAQWIEKPNNLPRWMGNDLTLSEPPYNAEKAQLTESRSFQVGETARMFLIPGPLLEYQMSGSSLTYRNEEDIWTDLQRRCLTPKYLEPIEQQMTDLMPRLWTSRFNIKQLMRADAKTRMEVHELAIKNGIYGPDVAAREEGYAPGSVDFAPVPFSQPSADLPAIPQNRSAGDAFRCSKCNWLLAETAGSGTVIRCRKCKTLNSAPVLQERADAFSQALMTLVNREPVVPNVTVHPSPITIEAAPAPNITFERGAFQIDAPPPAEVSVTPEFHIDAPDMSGVAEALVAVADRPQPEIHVDAPITVEPAQVTVNVPEQKDRVKRIERDEGGHLIRIVEESA